MRKRIRDNGLKKRYQDAHEAYSDMLLHGQRLDPTARKKAHDAVDTSMLFSGKYLRAAKDTDTDSDTDPTWSAAFDESGDGFVTERPGSPTYRGSPPEENWYMSGGASDRPINRYPDRGPSDEGYFSDDSDYSDTSRSRSRSRERSDSRSRVARPGMDEEDDGYESEAYDDVDMYADEVDSRYSSALTRAQSRYEGRSRSPSRPRRARSQDVPAYDEEVFDAADDYYHEDEHDSYEPTNRHRRPPPESARPRSTPQNWFLTPRNASSFAGTQRNPTRSSDRPSYRRSRPTRVRFDDEDDDDDDEEYYRPGARWPRASNRSSKAPSRRSDYRRRLQRPRGTARPDFSRW